MKFKIQNNPAVGPAACTMGGTAMVPALAAAASGPSVGGQGAVLLGSRPSAPERWWSAHELVVLGVFAAAAKVSTLLVALAGGGMNPVTLLAKNLIFTTLLVVMLYKVRKPGTLILFVLVNMLISMLLLGGSITLLPAMLGAALLAEGCVCLLGGAAPQWARACGPLVAVAVYDLVFRIFSLGVSWLFMRENPAMLMAAIPVIALGYVGAIVGLFTGHKAMKELRHAGIVRS